MNARRFGDWDELIRDFKSLGNPLHGFEENAAKATAKEALFWASSIKEGIRTQSTAKKTNWEPLKESTKRQRRIISKGGKRRRQMMGMKMLIDTGSLLRAIHAEKINELSYHIGVTRNQKSKDGTNLFNLAAIHELGTTVAGKDRNIVIPKRPFISPVVEELNKSGELEKRMMRRIVEEINEGKFGKKWPVPR